jgi:hypothetical protein
LRETIAFAREIEADYYSSSILAPHFGTRIFADEMAGSPELLASQPWEYFFHQSRP